MSGLDFSGMKQLQNQQLKMARDFEAFLKKFLIRQAMEVVKQAKLNTPVDTGLMRAAWTVGNQSVAARGKWNAHRTKKDKNGREVSSPGISYDVDEDLSQGATLGSVIRSGNQLVVTISNPIHYASFVEYGHMTRDRKGFINGKFMCTLAIDAVKAKMPARFQMEFDRWASTLGGG